MITHGANGVRNFWYLSAKILYTVEPKTATSPCVHFEVAASPMEKNTSLLHVSVLGYFETVEIIGANTREIIWSDSFTCWTTNNFQALLKSISSWVCFLPFASKHRSRTVRNPFYIHISSCIIDEKKKAWLRQIKKMTKPQLNLPRFFCFWVTQSGVH